MRQNGDGVANSRKTPRLAWTERACEPLTAEHEKGDTDMKGWAEPEHLHAQPGSQTAWVGEVA